VACFHPIPAWRSVATGVVSLRRHLESGGIAGATEHLRLPCGTCIGCRKARAREWAFRCSLELQEHDDACWATLTYDDDHLPPTLSKAHLQGFHKRLRARVAPRRVRFFASGEYGERTERPHYHTILYGVRDADEIKAAWPFGYARVDPISPAAIAYVAGYCSKKIGWKLEKGERVDYETGEVYEYQPPFVLMSRRPGIGGHARRYWRSWRDSAIYDGQPIPVPRFLHESYLKSAGPSDLAALLSEKRERAQVKAMSGSLSSERLEAGEAIALSRHAISSARRQKL
jgi:hypothetical protein